MDAAEFISIAGRVVTIGKAGPRTAISRAYYGLFHLAQELVKEFTAEKSGSGKSHNLVPQFLANADHPVAVAIARILADLHSERIKSDYHLQDSSVEDVGVAKTCVEQALNGQKLLEQFRHNCLVDNEVVNRLKNGVARVRSVHKA